uniref:Uncharacterized protein n=1 Tax=Mucochytrium quahogii TaxID=96639 RepID=A0A7S2SIE9_9STRA|mmetsp:Transcript_8148/g.13145  ORF Transcript_8148/g.13145 Transcript_8148/m.13145 type:complete len:218 (+) Transcript_8148:337-990(+)
MGSKQHADEATARLLKDLYPEQNFQVNVVDIANKSGSWYDEVDPQQLITPSHSNDSTMHKPVLPPENCKHAMKNVNYGPSRKVSSNFQRMLNLSSDSKDERTMWKKFARTVRSRLELPKMYRMRAPPSSSWTDNPVSSNCSSQEISGFKSMEDRPQNETTGLADLDRAREAAREFGSTACINVRRSQVERAREFARKLRAEAKRQTSLQNLEALERK